MSNTTEKMVAYCGLVCTDCPAYIATKENDEKKIEEIAAMWSKEYKADIKAESVWCDGCIVEGKKCAHCAVCEIRACAIQEEVKNCAHCVDYACKKLTQFFEMAPPAKDTLDEIAKNLKSV